MVNTNGKAIQIISIENGLFVLKPEFKEIVDKLDGPIGVISVVVRRNF